MHVCVCFLYDSFVPSVFDARQCLRRGGSRTARVSGHTGANGHAHTTCGSRIIRNPFVVLANRTMKIPVDGARAYAIRPTMSSRNTRISYQWFRLRNDITTKPTRLGRVLREGLVGRGKHTNVRFFQKCTHTHRMCTNATLSPKMKSVPPPSELVF